MLHATILEAEEARDAELKAILAEEYNLQLPNATVGATRKRPSAPAPVDPVALLPRAEAAFREARQALEQADLHKLQLGSQSSIKYPANDDDEDAQAAAQREWIREWEMRQARRRRRGGWLSSFTTGGSTSSTRCAWLPAEGVHVVWSLWTLCPCSLDDRRVIAGCS